MKPQLVKISENGKKAVLKKEQSLKKYSSAEARVVDSKHSLCLYTLDFSVKNQEQTNTHL